MQPGISASRGSRHTSVCRATDAKGQHTEVCLLLQLRLPANARRAILSAFPDTEVGVMPAILGLSAFYHDSAAALVVDGRIVAAAQEERFSRHKHDASFPREAISYCLN